MKIIQLCAIDLTIKVFLKPLVAQLMHQGFQVVCVCSEGSYTEELRREGLNIITTPIERRIGVPSNIAAIFRLYKLFKRERPDILHVHTPIASVMARIAARLAKVPIVVYTAHGFYFHDNMSAVKYAVFMNIEKFMARYFTDFIFTQSDEDRHTAVKFRFIDNRKVVCIGNGIDVFGRFNPQNVSFPEVMRLQDELGLIDGDIVITFIGRLVGEKGISDLLEAFSLIDKAGAKLLVVGDVDQGCRDQKTKDEITEKYKNNTNIIFTGFREDINTILYATDIFCLPSYREGMPRTIIEAMAMECAVVATDIRGCREEVIEGRTGFLVKPGSPEAIKSRLEQLIENEGLLNSMKKEGRRKAEKDFDEMKIVKRQIEIISRLYEDYKIVKILNRKNKSSQGKYEK